MNETITDLLSTVNTFAERFRKFSEEEFAAKPNPAKWSKKQILGHLIDSAQNNLRRFVVAQYESTPPKITYDQDFWVAANGYQHLKKDDVIELWKLTNNSIANVLKNMDPKNYSKQADTGKTAPELHPLEWLAADYNKHMKHHINQILPGSFDVIYK
ncbi:MAG TPA: DinB family protein [Chryseosolibacter sp.]